MSITLGELAALSCSFLWAACSLAFAVAGRRIGGPAVNQIRIHMGLVVLAVLHTVLIGGVVPVGVSTRQLVGLGISGLAGLAIGDLFLFSCMAVIGPRMGTLLMATSPLMTALIGFAFLGESLSMQAVVGMCALTTGVSVVLLDRSGGDSWKPPENHRGIPLAVVFGLLGALGQAVGLVLGRDAMLAWDDGETPVAPLSATLIRMAAGAVGMVVIAACAGQARTTVRALGDGFAMRATAIGTVFGPVLGVWMSQVAIANAKAGVAAPLMSLAPVVMLPIARFAYGAKPGLLGIVGTMVAVAGGAAIVTR